MRSYDNIFLFVDTGLARKRKCIKRQNVYANFILSPLVQGWLHLLQISPGMPPKNTTALLQKLRLLMRNTKYTNPPINAYIIPSGDAHVVCRIFFFHWLVHKVIGYTLWQDSDIQFSLFQAILYYIKKILLICILLQSEYIAPCDERRAFISGFTGSAGLYIVTALNWSSHGNWCWCNANEKQN